LSLFVCVAVLTVLVACAMLFRGGIAHGLAGIALVRRTGKPAGRFRCGVREVALWLPLILILLASAYLQLQWPAWFFGRSIVIACAIALLIGYAALGFRHPEQGPLDRLFGTHRVPI